MVLVANPLAEANGIYSKRNISGYSNIRHLHSLIRFKTVATGFLSIIFREAQIINCRWILLLANCRWILLPLASANGNQGPAFLDFSPYDLIPVSDVVCRSKHTV